MGLMEKRFGLTLAQYKIDIDTTILAVSIVDRSQLALLLGTGQVIRYHTLSGTSEPLFTIKKTELPYEDGGFDLSAKTSIYTLGSVVVTVNDYKRHGYIHYPGHSHPLHLWRKGNDQSHCRYPIGIYENDKGVPHIIYGEDWNRLQIMNLQTRQVLTASKSLIEEDAEERHIQFCKEIKKDHSTAPWPTPYDYYFGKLLMAPDNKHFMSLGWVWGSFDYYTVYNTEKFINSNRISSIGVMGGEHENRGACWIDNNTVACAYNPFMEDDEGATSPSDDEIHFYQINDGESKLEKKITVKGLPILKSQLAYDATHKLLICYSETLGIVLLSLEGEVLFHDKNIYIKEYHKESGLLLGLHNSNVLLYAISNDL